jgi:hypothetical protein
MSILASAIVYTRAGLAISQTHAVPRLRRESHPAVTSLAGLLAPPELVGLLESGLLEAYRAVATARLLRASSRSLYRSMPRFTAGHER